MQILTNGEEFLHATLLDSPTSLEADLVAPGREALSYGPVLDTVAPRRHTQWWGRFERDDTLQIEVQCGPTRGLRVEVLDQEFGRLGSRACGAGVTRFSIRIESGGVHYVRLRHESEKEGRFLLRVIQVRARRITARATLAQPSLIARLKRFIARGTPRVTSPAGGFAQSESA